MSARILYAEFTAKPGHEETVAGMIADLAVLVRREPGNVEFTPYRREDDPARFFVYEVYRDEDAFQAHISADYGAEFNRELGPLIVEPHSQLTWLVAV
ncbi:MULTISPECIES: putative quinol monooxygenase [unclassified Rathayibacter]|jgi:quinol monooxygenase YgiN|uniref:putative quinol monooxygenase n=1 Tax=unclassified Rathayibacter TaxID=2609250 RepID=UPI000CE8F1CC|nr:MULTISPECIES: putative quinol monooxygenase [unclassified Rathayibacter]PPF18691.1 antibiotic biosynthesis monooxygenase [Rathayibacter sp. AY1A4]PPF39517.1 antibiotic biosynthesis monooxygenase [Rathayibacter sp. AY1A3]PPG18006.1 antibiotic biosynthesis monooxygenase [Rathayibacter sp. AY1C6]PPG31688.1 antibiotic biosynthesis monooxygenase [Rathayibacter sp. AY2B9]PPG53171.1 antibiotic biosynthesis monooxygenase [Rathayibacter sp. AY2B3]